MAMIPQLAQLLARYRIPVQAPAPDAVEPPAPAAPKPKPKARKQTPRKGRK